MISSIVSNEELKVLIRNSISENNVGVILDSDFYNENSELNTEIIVNISVDDFYNSLGNADTPPAPDNLVVIKRGENKYAIYLIELKNLNKLRRLSSQQIKDKFTTAVNDFMSNRFSECFMSEDHKIVDFKVWLVCNRFAFMGAEMSDEDYMRRIKGTVMEKILLERPYKFRNHYAPINLMFSGTTIV